MSVTFVSSVAVVVGVVVVVAIVAVVGAKVVILVVSFRYEEVNRKGRDHLQKHNLLFSPFAYQPHSIICVQGETGKRM